MRSLFTLGARSLALSATLLALGATPALAGWSLPKPIVPGPPFTFDPAAVSCASTSFCATVGYSMSQPNAGAASTWNGKSWTEPRTIDATNNLTAVSCPAVGFCVALDPQGNSFVYSSGAWGPPIQIPGVNPTFGFLGSVSCASTTFCVAAYNGEAFIFNGSSWSAPQKLGAQLGAVSCPTTTFCLAAGGAGEPAFTYNGSSWSAAGTPGIGAGMISCSSPSVCMVAGGVLIKGFFHSAAVQWVNGTWRTPVILGSDGFDVAGVSCASASFCMAPLIAYVGVGNPGGNFLQWNGTTWTSSAFYEYAPTAVSCTSTSFCLAVDVGGHYLTWHGGGGA
ncbi:MAG TPA: hypothetical protein VKT31_01365 [Solirubrobacteraceae bacterium]|nr:hypothetical protein [Solirubrobacteraceae bacterium]